jgi:hypothetical protein
MNIIPLDFRAGFFLNPYDGWRYTASNFALRASKAERKSKEMRVCLSLWGVSAGRRQNFIVFCKDFNIR